MGIDVVQRACAGLSTQHDISETCTPHQTPILCLLIIVSSILQIEFKVRVECFSKATQPESGGQRALGMLAPSLCSIQYRPPDITILTNAWVTPSIRNLRLSQRGLGLTMFPG